MQKDFHFYTIYALARSAGFSDKDAFVVAYSSQHTDDAKYEHTLEFENGGIFQQVLTSHRFFDPGTISKPVCYKIWVPFHFLPGALGSNFYEKMFTKANSIVAQGMIEELLSSEPKPYMLHRLGIILHVYADTWSHQNFMGIIKEDMNDVKDMEVEEESSGFIRDFLSNLKEEILEYAAPMLGHAQAGTIPDEPYRAWEYTDYRDIRHKVINWERALDSAKFCYHLILRFLRRFPEYRAQKTAQWSEIEEILLDLFQKKGNLDERIANWKKAISDNAFPFRVTEADKDLNYDDREWFRSAVKVSIDASGKEHYIRLDEFEISNWKYFHDAALLHRFIIIHEILPQHQIICG